MKILALPKYAEKGASSRVRFLQYYDILEKNGIAIDSYPLLQNDYIESLYAEKKYGFGSIFKSFLKRIFFLFKSKQYDFVWIQRELFPGFPASFEVMLKRFKIKYAVDYDDAIFFHYQNHKNPIIKKAFGGKIDQVMKNAEVVIAGNNFILDYSKKCEAKTSVLLHDSIDLAHYKQKEYSEKSQSKIFKIAWIGTPPNSKYLLTISKALIQVAAVDVQLVLIGGKSLPQLSSLKQLEIDWSYETEVEELLKCDVGIMPLVDTEWEKGKCGYKLLQYMSCGLPVIASPVGINSLLVEHGENGYLAETPEQWLSALNDLKENNVLRKRMGLSGYKKVLNEFSIEEKSKELIAIFNHIVGK